MTDSYVYIVRCSDETLYTGWTNHPLQRIEAHSSGRGAKYTRGRGPVVLVYLEELEDKSAGLIREAKIKKLTRAEKERLIEDHRQRTADLEQRLNDIQKTKRDKIKSE